MSNSYRLTAFHQAYLAISNYQNLSLNHENIENSDDNIIEMLKDLLFLEYQSDSFRQKNLKIVDYLAKKKKKHILRTQNALGKGIQYFLEQKFKFNTDVLLVKTKYNWDKNSVNERIKVKKSLETKGEHFYLLFFSVLDNNVYEIYLNGISKILIDLYRHRDSFTGIELLDLVKNNKDYFPDNIEKHICSFLSSQIVYYNSITML